MPNSRKSKKIKKKNNGAKREKPMRAKSPSLPPAGLPLKRMVLRSPWLLTRRKKIFSARSRRRTKTLKLSRKPSTRARHRYKNSKNSTNNSLPSKAPNRRLPHQPQLIPSRRRRSLISDLIDFSRSQTSS